MQTSPDSNVQDSGLAAISAASWSLYARRIAGDRSVAWWTTVVITASSARQAECYNEEIRRRREQGRLPADVPFLIVPDPADTRVGSGAATLNCLRVLEETFARPAGRSLPEWWQGQRVIILHSGGDSRRLPQYSLSGKLFSALPVKTCWGGVSTVFDETLALSTPWAAQVPAGLVVGSGDVILTFEAELLRWDRPGVCGVAMPEPVEAGTQHGVYVTDEGRIYSFLQKPSVAEMRAAGGVLPGDRVALDIGLLRFDPAVTAALTEIGRATAGPAVVPFIDLYQHFTLALTGQWEPAPQDPPLLAALARALKGVPFWCSLVNGNFTHAGATLAFRRLLTGLTPFSQLYAAHQRLGSVAPDGVRSAGVVIDCAFRGPADLGPGAIAIECDLATPVRAASGAILHGLAGLATPVEIPEDTVVHQLPIILPDGRSGTVVRVYGVEDDPKRAGAGATWLGRPMLEAIAGLGLDSEDIWPGIPAGSRTLWNAKLFPFGAIEGAWDCARWMMGLGEYFDAARWKSANRLALASGTEYADTRALADAHSRRLRNHWCASAISLSRSGADIRPMLANAPGIQPLAQTGRTLSGEAASLEEPNPTEAASQYLRASLFLQQAGLTGESEQARAAAFAAVRRAVDDGMEGTGALCGAQAECPWRCESVTVSAPPRIDLGGGWSDTPPFCLDWGGTVLNLAIEINGGYPIRCTIKRLPQFLIRCISEESGEAAEYRSSAELLGARSPGSAFSIPRVALEMHGMCGPGDDLTHRLGALGGGIEIRTAVNLPMGSGLGTSSILAAAVLRALAEMRGIAVSDQELSDQVMRLEQLMTTGGGWQDQAGGIFPGAKLVSSGPGLRQRLRVMPLVWPEAIQEEFHARFVLYYTGIRRIAKNLLSQVVGSYLAREVSTVQVLHSIKTLAVEMAYALDEGDWPYLGELLNRHWRLNQVLDPHTTNAPINALLNEVRPWLSGTKLAGAGGGGFLLLLAKDRQAAAALREHLGRQTGPRAGSLYEFRIAGNGLRVTSE